MLKSTKMDKPLRLEQSKRKQNVVWPMAYRFIATIIWGLKFVKELCKRKFEKLWKVVFDKNLNLVYNLDKIKNEHENWGHLKIIKFLINLLLDWKFKKLWLIL